VLKSYDTTSLCDLIDRALHDFENKEKVKNYIVSGMHQKFDVSECAKKYLDLYEEM
jgi:glycogen synthase